jgi:hypothetical protein
MVPMLQRAFESANRSMACKERMIRSLLRSVSLEEKVIITMRKERLDAGSTGLNLTLGCDTSVNN